MNLISGLAVYFIVWWLCLFVVLPFGVKRPEADQVALGTDPGAPVRSLLWRKVLATTILATIIFACIYVYFGVYEMSLEDLLV